LAGLQKARADSDRQQYNDLLANPGLIPDQVERLKKLSQLRIGVPWWLSEVEYQHGVPGYAGVNLEIRPNGRDMVNQETKEDWDQWDHPTPTGSL